VHAAEVIVPLPVTPESVCPILPDLVNKLGATNTSEIGAATSPLPLISGNAETLLTTEQHAALPTFADADVHIPCHGYSSPLKPDEDTELGDITEEDKNAKSLNGSKNDLVVDQSQAEIYFREFKAAAPVLHAAFSYEISERTSSGPTSLIQSQTKDPTIFPASDILRNHSHELKRGTAPGSPTSQLELLPGAEPIGHLALDIASADQGFRNTQPGLSFAETESQDLHSVFAAKQTSIAFKQSDPELKTTSDAIDGSRPVLFPLIHPPDEDSGPLKPAVLSELRQLHWIATPDTGPSVGAAHMIARLEHQELQFGWDSPGFGRIEVRTMVDQNRVAATVSVPDNQLRDLLNSDLGSLHNALAAHSLQLSHFSAETGTSRDSMRGPHPMVGATGWKTEVTSAPRQEIRSEFLPTHVGFIDLRA
jgi:hypothetical protein